MEQLDPGLARERTKLAWARTAIAFAAVGGAILKKEPVAGLIVLAITPLIWGLGRFVGHTAERPELQPRRLLAVTVTVVAVALLAMVIAFVGHPPASLRDLLPVHG
jgi:uncharacterized membrane protein YidH (DUF202 family)